MNNEQKKALRSVMGGLGAIIFLVGAMTDLYSTEVGLLVALAIWIVGIPALGFFGLSVQKETKGTEAKSSSKGTVVAVVIGVVIVVALFALAGLGTTNSLFNGGMSGDVTSESRNVSDFSRVELSGSGDLIIDQTGRESLVIEADENLIFARA